MLDEDEKACANPPQEDVEEERSEIRQIFFSLHGEKKAIGRAFTFPTTGWCILSLYIG